MSPCNGGKYCGVCDKKVFDFTKSSQEEFNQVIAENGAVCGIFTTDQMMPKTPARYSLWRRVAAGIFIAFGLSSLGKELMAQNSAKRHSK